MIYESVRRFLRAVTSPVRGYVNNHFEMVKMEIRSNGSSPVSARVDMSEAWQHLSGLENTLAEQALHQSRNIARVSDDLEELAVRIEELERIVNRLADVVGASNAVQL